MSGASNSRHFSHEHMSHPISRASSSGDSEKSEHQAKTVHFHEDQQSIIHRSTKSKTSSSSENEKSEHTSSVKLIDFSRRPKILDYKDDDPRLFVDLDPDEFVKELKGMDSNHFDPLPCNIMWAWSQVDRDKTGIGSKKDIYWMKKNYTRFVDENVNINKLIQTLDTNMDRVLSKGEFRALLSAATGLPITAADNAAVMAHLASLAAACTHGGFTPTMTTDPRLVSRAIFEWWWTDPRAANQSGPRQRRRGHGDAANAHATVSRHLPEHNGQRGRVEDLSMDSLHVGDESDGHGGQGARDLVPEGPQSGLDFLREVRDRIQQACAPVGRALLVCSEPRLGGGPAVRS